VGCNDLSVRTASRKTVSALVAAESEDSGRRIDGGGVTRTVDGESKTGEDGGSIRWI
jgi:hypothetical protein